MEGLSEVAKQSQREYMRHYREKNRERLNRYHQDYYHANKDRFKKYQENYWSRKAIDPEEG